MLYSVLLVCSQMHHEYAHADCFNALSATISADFLDCFEENMRILSMNDRVRKSLTLVQHLSIMGRIPAPWGLGVSVWVELKRIIDALASCTPTLVSLKVVLRSPDLGLELHMSVTQEYEARSQALFLGNPPTDLAGLPLTTRGEGYRIGYSGYYLDQDKLESDGGSHHDGNHVGAESYYDIYHCTAPVGVTHTDLTLVLNALPLSRPQLRLGPYMSIRRTPLPF
ncbi:hypothetical protein BKA63DRAFT_526366 [Paraphoma chrysanthemicola]|nr:hypothetical protein BKA63DRAFT_526366 [Paraphoma chrysanthemicola]